MIKAIYPSVKRTMSALSIAFLLAVGTYSQSFAAGPNENYHVLGPGAQSCGSYTVNIAGDSDATLMAEGEFYWVEGYISAYNYYSRRDGNVTRETDSDGLKAWIGNYCQAHPLDDIATAATALISELRVRNKR